MRPSAQKLPPDRKNQVDVFALYCIPVSAILFPKSDCQVEPAFGNGADAKPEAVSEPRVGMILGRDAHGGKCVDSPFHGAVVCNAVALADRYEGGGLACGVVIGMPRVLDHRDARFWNSGAAAEGFHAVGSNRSRHASACTSAPDGIAVCIHAEGIGIGKMKEIARAKSS